MVAEYSPNVFAVDLIVIDDQHALLGLSHDVTP